MTAPAASLHPFDLLRVGPLPSTADLRALERWGCRDLVNVSGIDLRRSHPRLEDHGLRLRQYRFRDVFTPAPGLDAATLARYDDPAPQIDYMRSATDDERAEFLSATRAVAASLRRQRPVYLCCHRGQGRSPAVAAAALHSVYPLPAGHRWRAVMTVAPGAHISPVTLAAAAWYLAQPAPEDDHGDHDGHGDYGGLDASRVEAADGDER